MLLCFFIKRRAKAKEQYWRILLTKKMFSPLSWMALVTVWLCYIVQWSDWLKCAHNRQMVHRFTFQVPGGALVAHLCRVCAHVQRLSPCCSSPVLDSNLSSLGKCHPSLSLYLPAFLALFSWWVVQRANSFKWTMGVIHMLHACSDWMSCALQNKGNIMF